MAKWCVKVLSSLVRRQENLQDLNWAVAHNFLTRDICFKMQGLNLKIKKCTSNSQWKSNPGQYTLSILIFSSKSMPPENQGIQNGEDKTGRKGRRNESILWNAKEENKREMLLWRYRKGKKKVTGHLKSLGLVSGDRRWCLEQNS